MVKEKEEFRMKKGESSQQTNKKEVELKFPVRNQILIQQ